jgi:hypothetical protein
LADPCAAAKVVKLRIFPEISQHLTVSLTLGHVRTLTTVSRQQTHHSDAAFSSAETALVSSKLAPSIGLWLTLKPLMIQVTVRARRRGCGHCLLRRIAEEYYKFARFLRDLRHW